jgi:hypothetical protein
MERNPHDEHARLTFTAPQGTVQCVIRFHGGVEVISPALAPLLGNASAGTKITTVELRNNSLMVEADVNNAGAASFEIKTQWKSASVEGGTIRQSADNLYEVDFDRSGIAPDAFGYTHRRAIIHFESGMIR